MNRKRVSATRTTHLLHLVIMALSVAFGNNFQICCINPNITLSLWVLLFSIRALPWSETFYLSLLTARASALSTSALYEGARKLPCAPRAASSDSLVLFLHAALSEFQTR